MLRPGLAFTSRFTNVSLAGPLILPGTADRSVTRIPFRQALLRQAAVPASQQEVVAEAAVPVAQQEVVAEAAVPASQQEAVAEAAVPASQQEAASQDAPSEPAKVPAVAGSVRCPAMAPGLASARQSMAAVAAHCRQGLAMGLVRPLSRPVWSRVASENQWAVSSAAAADLQSHREAAVRFACPG